MVSEARHNISFQRTLEAHLGIDEIGLLENLRNGGARRSEARPGNELVFLIGEARQPVAGCDEMIYWGLPTQLYNSNSIDIESHQVIQYL